MSAAQQTFSNELDAKLAMIESQMMTDRSQYVRTFGIIYDAQRNTGRAPIWPLDVGRSQTNRPEPPSTPGSTLLDHDVLSLL